MIGFTTLELTLLALCVGLFVYGMHYRTKTQAMFHLVSAMCTDETVFKQVKQAYDELERA